MSAESARQRFEFESSGAGPEAVLDGGDVDLVVVATPHDSHAQLVVEALRRDVAVYVEKPLALDWISSPRSGQRRKRALRPLCRFNRRYARPRGAEVRCPPRLMHFRVNSGPVPPAHWTNDLELGGRLKGRGVTLSISSAIRRGPTQPGHRLRLRVELGAVARSDRQLQPADPVQRRQRRDDQLRGRRPDRPGKEREVSARGAYAVIDDFRAATIWRGRGKASIGSRRAGQGLGAQFDLIRAVIAGEAEPPAPEGYLLSTMVTLAAARSLETGVGERVVERAPAFSEGPSPG